MKAIYLAVVLMIFSCRDSPEKKGIEICNQANFSQTVYQVSFANLEGLKKLNGKFVEIEGIFHHYFEDSGIYSSENPHSSVAIWVNLVFADSLLDKLNKKRVIAIGKVNILQKGHLNGYLASLDSVFCIREILH